MAWKNIPEKKVLATLKDKSALKGTVSEKFDIYVDGAVPGGDGDVQGISMTIDPSTYVMTTQLKDGKGGNVGSPATIDLPLESMVVGGEYDDNTKSVILTLKNGQTITFSVADLVAGLQTEITSENPLSADLIEETTNKNFVTSEEKEDISSISGLADDVETLNTNVEGLQSDVSGLNDDINNLASDVSTLQSDVSTLQSDLDNKQDTIDGNNPLDASYIDDTNSDQKLVSDSEKDAISQIAENGVESYAKMSGDDGYVEFNNDNACHLDVTVIQNGSQNPVGMDINVGDVFVHLANGTSADIAQFDGSTVTSAMLDSGIYSFDPNEGVQFYIDDNQEYEITDVGTIIMGPLGGEYGELRTIYFIPADGSAPITYLYNNEGTVTESTGVNTADLQTALATKQDVIDSNHKLSADLIAETNDKKVMTASERTKLSGIATGAEVNVQSDWNITDSSSDAFIKNKPTNVSAFTNDSGYQDASQVSSAIASAVGQITSFEYQVVQALPVTGEKGVIYLVANTGTTPNIYDEYIWVNNTFEKIGTTDIDLSGYATTQDLEDGLATKADAIDPADLPSGSTQNGVITTSDHTDIDPSVVSEGQIVVDSTDGKVYIVSEITIDPETGDPVTIVWKEIQTDKEIVYADMTITNIQAMTFVVNDYTATEIHSMLNAGMSVFYRLSLPQAVGGLAAGVYDFRPVYHTNGAVMSSLSGSASNNSLLGIAYHTDVGTSYIELCFLQNQIDSNNMLSADLVDSSNSTNKTYITGNGAPTTSTAGAVGEMYVDKSTGAVYVCTGVNGGVYTWTEIVAKDRVKTLTTADYNYPTSGTKTSIALWLLPSGVYDIGEALAYKANINNTTSTTAKDENHFIIINRQGLATVIEELSPLGIMHYSTNASTGAKGDVAKLAFVDDLNTTDTSRGLTANQGKVLNEKIEGRVKIGSGAPTTATVGTVGSLYEDTTNGKLYQCTAIVPGTDPDPDTYTWEKVVVGTAVSTISSQDWSNLWQ